MRGKARLKEMQGLWKGVFIDEDLNLEERRKRVELRVELKRLREEGVYCFLEGMEIVKKGFWNKKEGTK